MFQKQDPDYQGFTGTLKTDLRIGMGALVEVEVSYLDDEFVDIKVMYRGVDIADPIGNEGHNEIHKNIDANWRTLVQQAIREQKHEEH